MTTTTTPPEKQYICLASASHARQSIAIICCCCVVVLRPRYTAEVMSRWSVNLTTLFLGRLRPPKWLTSTSCTYFRQCYNVLPFLNNPRDLDPSYNGESRVAAINLQLIIYLKSPRLFLIASAIICFTLRKQSKRSRPIL